LTDEKLYAPFICPVNIPLFWVDIASWSIDEVGAYTRLLWHEWINGPLPKDTKRLQRIAGCSNNKFNKIWPIVGKKFKDNGNDCFINLRMETIRQEQKEFRDKKSRAGKMGMQSRYNK